MSLMWCITFGFRLLIFVLLTTDAMVTIELWMKQFSLPRTETLPELNSLLSNCSLTVALHVGNQTRQMWNFSAKFENRTNNGEMYLHFPEHLYPAQHNPLVYTTSYGSLEGSSVGLTVVVHSARRNAALAPIARFHTVWNIRTPIAAHATDAPLRKESMVDNGARLTLFVRWYCSNRFRGDRCDLPCNAHSCDLGERANDFPQTGVRNGSEPFSLTAVRIPPLGDSDCPCDHCLIVDVPEINLLNRTMLQTYMNLFVLLRADMSGGPTEGFHPRNLPVHVNTRVQLRKMLQSNDHPVVAICASAIWNNQELEPKIIRKSLVDLVTSGWIYTVLANRSRPGIFTGLPASSLVKEVNDFVEAYRQIVSNCNAIMSSQAVLLGGFWLALCMTVVMSCLVAYLLHKQKNAEKDTTVHSVDEDTCEQYSETKYLINTVS